nr:hypothetical protein JVH1_6833 [Rhodococcus sp. JVH1]
MSDGVAASVVLTAPVRFTARQTVPLRHADPNLRASQLDAAPVTVAESLPVRILPSSGRRGCPGFGDVRICTYAPEHHSRSAAVCRRDLHRHGRQRR